MCGGVGRGGGGFKGMSFSGLKYCIPKFSGEWGGRGEGYSPQPSLSPYANCSVHEKITLGYRFFPFFLTFF